MRHVLILALGAAMFLAACGADQRESAATQQAAAATEAVDELLGQGEALLEDFAADPLTRYPEEDDSHEEDEDEGHEHAEDPDEVRAHQAARCSDRAAQMAPDWPQFAAFGRADPDLFGAVDCLSVSFDPPVWVGDRAYYVRAGSWGTFAVGDYQFDGGDATKTLGMASPLLGGIGFAWLYVSAIDAAIAEIGTAEGTDVILADSNGTIIARPQFGYTVGRNIANTELGQALLTRDSGTAEFAYEGQSRLYAFAVPERSHGDIRIAVGIPADDD